MPFISSGELCSRIKALYRKTLHLNNSFLSINMDYCLIPSISSSKSTYPYNDIVKKLALTFLWEYTCNSKASLSQIPFSWRRRIKTGTQFFTLLLFFFTVLLFYLLSYTALFFFPFQPCLYTEHRF